MTEKRDVTALHDSRELKMPCGCYGEYRQGNAQATWLVTAEAFLCKQRHKQGQVVVVVDHGSHKP